MEKTLPAIPAKRYFTIGEVSELCGVKPYVLRYWEQEFTQLKPMKRRGNRRYYQHHEVLLIRRIRELLYDQGFTISGARNRLADAALSARSAAAEVFEVEVDEADFADAESVGAESGEESSGGSIIETAAAHLRARAPEVRAEVRVEAAAAMDSAQLRVELMSIRELLSI